MSNIDSTNEVLPHRFHEHKLWEDPSAEVKNFKPVENGRDKFGNRLFRSPEHYYFDRADEKVKAALLVSRKGELLIKNNPGILNDLDQGLIKMEYTSEPGNLIKRRSSVDLGKGRKLTYIAQGGQSQVYILEANGNKYAVKTKSSKYINFPDPSQPYINEMLQMQDMTENLKEEFAKLSIRLPSFLFASGQVGCAEFVEGEKPTAEDFANKSEQLRTLVKDYLGKKKLDGDPLWENISSDLFVFSKIKTLNFVKEKDGTLVWVDPLFYDDPKELSGL